MLKQAQMLCKTIPPLVIIALCVFLSLVVSGCSGTTQAQVTPTIASIATSEPTSAASQPLPTLERHKVPASEVELLPNNSMNSARRASILSNLVLPAELPFNPSRVALFRRVAQLGADGRQIKVSLL